MVTEHGAAPDEAKAPMKPFEVDDVVSGGAAVLADGADGEAVAAVGAEVEAGCVYDETEDGLAGGAEEERAVEMDELTAG